MNSPTLICLRKSSFFFFSFFLHILVWTEHLCPLAPHPVPQWWYWRVLQEVTRAWWLHHVRVPQSKPSAAAKSDLTRPDSAGTLSLALLSLELWQTHPSRWAEALSVDNFTGNRILAWWILLLDVRKWLVCPACLVREQAQGVIFCSSPGNAASVGNVPCIFRSSTVIVVSSCLHSISNTVFSEALGSMF